MIFSKKGGFSLIEIMIAIIIIGLLATFALPAIKKLRASSIEKSLLNDARQITASAQQYCAENACMEVSGSSIAHLFVNSSFSSGVTLGEGISPGNNTVGGAYILSMTEAGATNEYFTLSHPNYDKSLSTNIKLQSPFQSIHNGIIFRAQDGQPAH